MTIPSIPPSAPSKLLPSLNGNGLQNFFNPSLQTNGRKTIFYIGNSTVWNASAYFIEFCNAFINNPTLAALGLTPVNNSISGYQVLDNVGTIQLTFTGTTPTQYSVGDLILSQPVLASLNTLTGTGQITAIGASTITYTLVSYSVLPSTTAFTSSNGYVTNSILNLGQNGATSSAIITSKAVTLLSNAKAGDLVFVRGPLINDVRLGNANLTQATANITALYTSIAANIPSNCDIAWKTENSMLTTDPTSSGYVSPLGSSAAYSKILNKAVYAALNVLPSRVVFWDTMQIVYSKLGQEYATSTWMNDILHPSLIAQTREASADAQIFSAIGSGKGFPSVRSLSDPYEKTGNSGALLHGGKNHIDYLRSLVNFSTFLASHASADNYATPWVLYPDVVLDPDMYDVIAYGNSFSFGPSFIRFTQPSPIAGVSEIQPNDLVWMANVGVFQIPNGFSSTAYNSGGSVYITQIANLGVLVPTSLTLGCPVVVLRQRSYAVADVAYLDSPATYPYKHRVFSPAAGTNYIRLQFTDGTPSWPNGLTSSDVLVFPSGVVPLTGASISLFSTYMQITLTGNWAALNNQSGWVFGTHASEVNAAVVLTPVLANVNILATPAPPTIASATTIAPNTSSVFISGTTAINTISPPSPINTGGGQITLIPTGLFTTTTAGNIALASTAIIGRSLTMTYDSVSSKWYPSY